MGVLVAVLVGVWVGGVPVAVWVGVAVLVGVKVGDGENVERISKAILGSKPTPACRTTLTIPEPETFQIQLPGCPTGAEASPSGDCG